MFIYRRYTKPPSKKTSVHRLTCANKIKPFLQSKTYPICLQQMIHLLSASSVYTQQFYLHQQHGGFHIRSESRTESHSNNQREAKVIEMHLLANKKIQICKILRLTASGWCPLSSVEIRFDSLKFTYRYPKVSHMRTDNSWTVPCSAAFQHSSSPLKGPIWLPYFYTHITYNSRDLVVVNSAMR